MRALVLVLVAFACAPKAATTPRAFDDDLEPHDPAGSAATAAGSEDQRPVAPPGKGLRTGTIARDHLLAVLDAGPAMFLRQLEVAPRLSGDRFVGWQLVQLIDRQGPLYDIDLVPGDVLLAINGQSVSRPEQLQAVWDSLRTANEVIAQMSRGDTKLELHFTIEPPVH